MGKTLKQLKEAWSRLVEEESRKYRIFCDLDGTLTAFEEQFKAVSGQSLSPREYEEAHGKGSIWKIIEEAGEEFWSEMPWLPDGKTLWNFIEPFDPIILSAPSRDRKSVSGKLKWLQNNVSLPNYNIQLKSKNGWDGESRIILNSQKYRYVRDEFDILVDDTEKKITDWNRAGGTGILHKSAQATISRLRELGI